MSERPKVCDLLDAMERAPLAAREEALSLIDEQLAKIARGEGRARAFEDIALYARLAADNERVLARLPQLTPLRRP